MLLRHGPENNPDRRAMRRFSMQLPASVRVSGIPVPFETETVNVSARGIFFYIDRWMKEGAQVEVTMDFPSQVTMADPLRVRFLARIVRVEPQEGMHARGRSRSHRGIRVPTLRTGRLTRIAAGVELWGVVGSGQWAVRIKPVFAFVNFLPEPAFSGH